MHRDGNRAGLVTKTTVLVGRFREKVSGIVGDPFIADEMPLEYIHLKRCLAYELQGVSRKPSTLAAKNLRTPIPADDVERILSNPDKWKGRGFAKAGLVLGILPLLFFLVLFIALLNWDNGKSR